MIHVMEPERRINFGDIVHVCCPCSHEQSQVPLHVLEIYLCSMLLVLALVLEFNQNFVYDKPLASSLPDSVMLRSRDLS